MTTNPPLISRVSGKFEDILREICEIVDGPISAEIVSLDVAGIVAEGRALHNIHKNNMVKVPIFNEGIKAVKILEDS